LHVFEIRYREMLAEALEGDCLFGVARLTAEESPDLAACVAPVGTVGLIRASREKGDGRSDLLLHGVCRVQFLEWLAEKPYPFARIKPLDSRPLTKEDAPGETQRLRMAVEGILLGLPDEIVNQIRDLLDRAAEPAVMADAIAQQFVHDPDLRQALLEETDVARRIDQLVAYLATLRSADN
jgi:Lon protease-like protein